jgi:hypothetical protein
MNFKCLLLALMLVSVTPGPSHAVQQLVSPTVAAPNKLARIPNAAEKELIIKALNDYMKANSTLISKIANL